MANTLVNLTSKQLRRAAALKERLEALHAQFVTLLGAPAAPQPPTSATKPRKKGTMSAAGRARIRAAQKARWAKVKAAQKPAQPPKKKKFTMSAAAKAAIGKAAKARWAKLKAAQKK
jgi:hypothetical protein